MVSGNKAQLVERILKHADGSVARTFDEDIEDDDENMPSSSHDDTSSDSEEESTRNPKRQNEKIFSQCRYLFTLAVNNFLNLKSTLPSNHNLASCLLRLHSTDLNRGNRDASDI